MYKELQKKVISILAFCSIVSCPDDKLMPMVGLKNFKKTSQIHASAVLLMLLFHFSSSHSSKYPINFFQCSLHVNIMQIGKATITLNIYLQIYS